MRAFHPAGSGWNARRKRKQLRQVWLRHPAQPPLHVANRGSVTLHAFEPTAFRYCGLIDVTPGLAGATLEVPGHSWLWNPLLELRAIRLYSATGCNARGLQHLQKTLAGNACEANLPAPPPHTHLPGRGGGQYGGLGLITAVVLAISAAYNNSPDKGHVPCLLLLLLLLLLLRAGFELVAIPWKLFLIFL